MEIAAQPLQAVSVEALQYHPAVGSGTTTLFQQLSYRFLQRLALFAVKLRRLQLNQEHDLPARSAMYYLFGVAAGLPG